jgi:hypothetical protein
VGLDRGLTPYPLVDPVLIADTTANGQLSALDSTRILQEVVGLNRPEIPPVPPGLVIVSGRDPLVSLPTTLQAAPGGMVTVPVTIDDALGLEAGDLVLGWDTSQLEVVAVRTGTVTAGATLMTHQPAPTTDGGLLHVGLVLRAPRPGSGGGSLLEVDYRVAPIAEAGPIALDLRQVTLNEGGLVLTPLPVPGPDPTDGRITVVNAAAPALAEAAIRPALIGDAAGPATSPASSSSEDELRAATLRADELLRGNDLRTIISRAAASRPRDAEGALVDWSGGASMSERVALGRRPAALRREAADGATTWVRPFLLELATRAADDPNRDLRIALPAAAETLPAVEVLA